MSIRSYLFCRTSFDLALVALLLLFCSTLHAQELAPVASSGGYWPLLIIAVIAAAVVGFVIWHKRNPSKADAVLHDVTGKAQSIGAEIASQVGALVSHATDLGKTVAKQAEVIASPPVQAAINAPTAPAPAVTESLYGSGGGGAQVAAPPNPAPYGRNNYGMPFPTAAAAALFWQSVAERDIQNAKNDAANANKRGHGPIPASSVSLDEALYLGAMSRVYPNIQWVVLDGSSDEVSGVINLAGSTHAAELAQYNPANYTGRLKPLVDAIIAAGHA